MPGSGFWQDQRLLVPGWARTTILSVNSRARWPIAPQRHAVVLGGQRSWVVFFRNRFCCAQTTCTFDIIKESPLIEMIPQSSRLLTMNTIHCSFQDSDTKHQFVFLSNMSLFSISLFFQKTFLMGSVTLEVASNAREIIMVLVLCKPLWKKPRKAPLGFEPRISCLLDRHFDQLSHGALTFSSLTESYMKHEITPQPGTQRLTNTQQHHHRHRPVHLLPSLISSSLLWFHWLLLLTINMNICVKYHHKHGWKMFDVYLQMSSFSAGVNRRQSNVQLDFHLSICACRFVKFRAAVQL